MFCKNCGQQIDDNAVVCPHCGVQVAKVKTQSNDDNGIAIVGFVLFFLGMSFIGLILSIVGYKNAKNNGADHKGIAIAGIVLNALELAGCVLAVIIIIAVGGSFLSTLSSQMSAVCSVL